MKKITMILLVLAISLSVQGFEVKRKYIEDWVRPYEYLHFEDLELRFEGSFDLNSKLYVDAMSFVPVVWKGRYKGISSSSHNGLSNKEEVIVVEHFDGSKFITLYGRVNDKYLARIYINYDDRKVYYSGLTEKQVDIIFDILTLSGNFFYGEVKYSDSFDRWYEIDL